MNIIVHQGGMQIDVKEKQEIEIKKVATQKGSNSELGVKGQGEKKVQGIKESNELSNQSRLKPIILHTTHFPVLSSSIAQTISEGIARLSHAPAVVNMERSTVDFNEKDRIELVWDGGDKIFSGIRDIETAQRNVRLSQVQLFQYLLYQYNRQQRLNVILDIRDYFKLRGIARRKENVDRFYQDLMILSCITIDLTGKNRGYSERMMGSILTIIKALTTGGKEVGLAEKGEKIASVVVELGDWFKMLKQNQYILLPKIFFEYVIPNQNPAILLSLKFNQLCRVNYGKAQGEKFNKVTVRSLLWTMGVTEKDVAKQGSHYYQRLLERNFLLLKKEGYHITFEKVWNGNSKGFLKSIVLYQNEDLSSIYQNIKGKSANHKKKETIHSNRSNYALD